MVDQGFPGASLGDKDGGDNRVTPLKVNGDIPR